MWKKTIKNSAIVFAGVVFSRLFIFLSNTIIVRQLSIAEYATFSLLTSIFTWVLVFSHLDLYSAISRFVSESSAQKDFNTIRSFYNNASFMVFALSLVGIVISSMLSYEQKVMTVPRIIFMAGLVPLALMTINDGLLKGLHLFKLSALIDSSNGLSRFLLLAPALLIFGKLNLENILILVAIATLLPFLLSYLFATRAIREPFHSCGLTLDVKVMAKLFHYSKWVCVTDFVNAGLFLFANFVISASSPDDLARFNIIILLYSIFLMFFGAITTVLIPMVSQAVAHKNTIKMMGIKEIVILFILTFSVIAAIILMPFKEKILMLLFGKSLYSNSLNYVALLLMTFPFKIVSTTNRGIVQGLNRPIAIAISSLLTFVISACILFLSYNRYGLIGSIIGLNVSHLIEFFFLNKVTRRVLKTYESSISSSKMGLP